MERDFKGVWIPREIWLSEELSLMEKILFVEIHSLDNERGCFASNQYFADFFGMSDREENERSLREGCRLMSVYRTTACVKFYIITEHDRSVTTVLLPDEY